MYEVSDKFKQYCKRHQRFFKEATITYEENGITKTIDSSNIIKLEISATPYVDYQILGQAPGKKIHINLQGTDYNLTNKEISVSTTMIYDDNTTETLTLGNYIISSDYESQVKDQCSFTGYDYMIKFDQKYSDEGLEYPCTLQDVLNDMCDKLDIELYSTNITNGGLQVTGNNFDDSSTYRDVLKQLSQASGTFAYIDRLNRLHVDNLNKPGPIGGTILQFKLQGTLQIDGETIESNIATDLTPSYYMKDFRSSRLYGPVNKVQLTQSNIEDATYREDRESIRQDGIQTITINDNYFLGTIEAREYAIKNLWTALRGLTYIPFKSTYLGFPYLEMGDLIEIEQLDESKVVSYVFNYTFTYDGGYMGTLETPTITRTQEEYPTDSIDSKVKKIGVNVDRANAEIKAVVEDVSGVTAELSLKVDKDDNDQIISMINASADVITLNSNRLVINSTYFQLDENGNITATSGDIGGFSLGTNLLTANLVSPYVYTQADVDRISQILQGNVTPTYEDYQKYDIDRSGTFTSYDYLQVTKYVQGTANFTGTYLLDTLNSLQALQVKNQSDSIVANIGIYGSYFNHLSSTNLYVNNLAIFNENLTIGKMQYSDGNINVETNHVSMTDETGAYISLMAYNAIASFGNSNMQETIHMEGDTGNITCVSLTQTSKAEEKKDFEKYQGALKELENIDIYKYRMKNEDGKKHIGFVIGDDFKYSKEVTNQNNDGVDVYSFVSLCCQAIKELQEEIKELRGKINE
jgi:hypothetical protein